MSCFKEVDALRASNLKVINTISLDGLVIDHVLFTMPVSFGSFFQYRPSGAKCGDCVSHIAEPSSPSHMD